MKLLFVTLTQFLVGVGIQREQEQKTITQSLDPFFSFTFST